MKRQLFWTRCACLLGLALTGGVAQAASVSYFLDQTNVSPTLPDGSNYLQVTISDATFGTDAAAIRFDVTLLDALTDIAGDNFGVQAFGFSTAGITDDVVDAIVGLPSGWGADADRNMSAFGRYDVQVSGTGSNRQSPTLTFYIAGIDGDVVADYAQLSSGNAGDGNQFFAAHVAGFTVDGAPTVTSGFFAGVSPVPLPATAWLFLAGLGAAAARTRRRPQTA
jgi:hypothetical protein